MPIAEFQGILRAKPVGTLRLKTLSLPADPTSDKIVLVSVQVMVKTVEIDILSAVAPRCRRICVHGFNSQVELRYAGYPRQINAGANSGAPRGGKRGAFSARI
jgi:hypothetical protein